MWNAFTATLEELSRQYEKIRVLAASRRLSKVVAETKELRDGNALLIEGALMAVNRQLGRIGGAVVDPVYGSGGTEQVRHLRKNLDYEA